jgi:SAM-dependent methyltransferase
MLGFKAPKTSRRSLLPGLRVKEGFMRHPFDEAFQVQTSGLIAGRHLATGHTHDRHNTAYYGIAPSVFHHLCRLWLASQPYSTIENYTFLDIGAGMGRALLLAAEMPFHEAIGIEINPDLARIAKKNIQLWTEAKRDRCPMQILTQDATAFEFPDHPCVAFLFNPFSGTVLRRFLKQIESAFRHRPGQLDILYVNHEFGNLINANARFTQCWSGDIYKSAEDEKADREILLNQPEGEYASSEYESCSIYRFTGTPAVTRSLRRK